jgi:hypothetical protein
MSHVFADGGQTAELVSAPPGGIPKQGGRGADPPPSLGPAMTPGKGVRHIRCVGCSLATLPRPDDGAPLCQRCSELLAPVESRAPRWFRRRADVGREAG